ncbi:OmpA family protein, partial [Acinetobacter sp. MD2(2019)]|uniref:OmpA family protein n=1 Tax=Acinetobacter sp. MD2(2019) TaxID=2605273 RepID=UPI002D1F449C
SLVLSVDASGQPFMSNNGKPLACQAPEPVVATSSVNTAKSTVVETTVNVNLAADTLFKFNGSSLNDLLPKGRQEVVNVASQITNNFVSVSHIALTGYTDRLGNANYNQQLGQRRAETVRQLLVQNGVASNVISVASSGKNKPVTNGCFDVKQRDALKACLQPDRRVTVAITGIAK